MNRKSGKIAGANNARAFEEFIAARNKDGRWREYILPGGRDLNKTAICQSKECNFARSVFVQNPAVRSRCASLVDELAAKGILKGESDNIPPLSCAGLTRDEAVAEIMGTIVALETEIAGLLGFLKEVDDKAGFYEAEAKIIIKGRYSAKEGTLNGKSEKRTATERYQHPGISGMDSLQERRGLQAVRIPGTAQPDGHSEGV